MSYVPNVIRLATVALLCVACGKSERPAVESAASAPSVVPTPAPAATDSVAAPIPAPAGSTPAAHDTAKTPSRPRMRPRPPHPVPLPVPRGDSGSPSMTGDQAVDQKMLDRLRTEAHALAHVDGCSAASECAVIAIGERACGGPEEHIVYCPRSTDVAALKRKAAEIASAQRAFNRRYQLMSTCELRVAPATELVGGSCRAVKGAAGPVLRPQ